MKKIIYSLVIMIAAGSLFTSCIEPVEPAGLLDLRTAKAEYIRALKDLRAADAELQRALAAVEQANARYRDAETAYKNAETDSLKRIAELQAKYQELVNEAKAIENDMLREDFKVKQQQVLAEIEAIKQQMENNQKQHEIDLVGYQQQLAQAQENLRVALRNIALASKELTSSEQTMLNTLVTAYETAVKDVMDQQVTVMQKKQEYDAEVAKLDSVDLVWDSDEHAFVEIQAIWQKNIDAAKAAQEEYAAALENVPEQPQLEEWDAYLQEYVEDSLEWAMKRWEVTKDSAELMVTVHDAASSYASKHRQYRTTLGIYDSFDKALYGYTDAYGTHPKQLQLDKQYGYYPTQLTPEEPEYVEGTTSYKPINDVYIVNEKGNKEYYGPDYSSSTDPAGKKVAGTDMQKDKVNTFPVLEGSSSIAYQKFDALISSYTASKNYKYYDATGAHDQSYEVITKSGDNYSVTANLDMKEFLLADTMTNVNGAVLNRFDKDSVSHEIARADYGLRGAVNVLERLDVIVNGETKSWPDTLAKYKKIWENDRETLAVVYNYGVKENNPWHDIATTATPKKEAAAVAAKGGPSASWSYLYAYPDYKTALTAADEKNTAVTTATNDSIAKMGAIKSKLEAFDKAWNGLNPVLHSSALSTPDSAKLWGAMQEYILARAAYMKMPDPTSKDGKTWYTKNFGKYENPLYFYYASRSDVTPPEVDSVLWVDFAAKDYTQFQKKEDRTGHCVIPESPYAYDYNTGDAADDGYEANVFRAIAAQLFGPSFETALATEAVLPETVSKTDFEPQALFSAVMSLYTAEDNGTKVDIKAAVTDRADMCWTLKPIADRDAAFGVLQDQIDNYCDLYNRYWGYAAFPGEDKDRDPKCYQLETFTEPYPIAVFVSGVPQATSGLRAVLASVDPNGNNETDPSGDTKFPTILGYSRIFGDAGVPSDFCKYMEAEWENTQGASSTLKADVAKIKAWADDVEAYFDKYKEEQAALSKKVYEADKEVYETLVEYAEFWYNAYVGLTGGEFVNAEGEKCIDMDNYPIQTTVALGNPWTTNFCGSGYWWLDGAQLTFAQGAFGEDFPTTYNDLKKRNNKINDEIAHNNIILKAMQPAYVAAAKIAQYNTLQAVDEQGNIKDTTFYTGDNFYELMACYQIARENYVNELNREIADQEKIIDDNMYAMATYTSGVAAQEYVVAQKARDLAKEEAKLEMLMDKLEKLQEAIDSLVAYLEGTGAEFILPNIEGIGTAHRGTTEIVGPDFNFGGQAGGNAGIGGVTLDQLVAWIQGLFNGGEE